MFAVWDSLDEHAQCVCVCVCFFCGVVSKNSMLKLGLPFVLGLSRGMWSPEASGNSSLNTLEPAGPDLLEFRFSGWLQESVLSVLELAFDQLSCLTSAALHADVNLPSLFQP